MAGTAGGITLSYCIANILKTMDLQQFHKNVLNDVRIELKDEFDRNFERKAFFDKSWPKNKLLNRKGSQMARTNNLRRSINAKVTNGMIQFSSSLPYASLQNEGGEVTVTHKMKKYFWYMFYEVSGHIKLRKDGNARKSKSNTNLSIEAQQWKNLALMKVGTKMKIPAKQFIGEHPRIKQVIEDIVNDNLKDLNDIILNQLNQNR